MMKPMVVVFNLLEVDFTLGDSCMIGGHWHSFREVKCLQDFTVFVLVLIKEMRMQASPRFHLVCLV